MGGAGVSDASRHEMGKKRMNYLDNLATTSM